MIVHTFVTYIHVIRSQRAFFLYLHVVCSFIHIYILLTLYVVVWLVCVCVVNDALFKKNINNFIFQIFLLAIVLWCIKKDSANFHTKNSYLIKAPAIFWKLKLCRACDARARGKICRFFGMDLLNNLLDQQKRVAFRKS